MVTGQASEGATESTHCSGARLPGLCLFLSDTFRHLPPCSGELRPAAGSTSAGVSHQGPRSQIAAPSRLHARCIRRAAPLPMHYPPEIRARCAPAWAQTRRPGHAAPPAPRCPGETSNNNAEQDLVTPQITRGGLGRGHSGKPRRVTLQSCWKEKQDGITR